MGARLRYVFILILLFAMVGGATAQQDPIQRIVDKAIEAANAAIPTLGRPISWQWLQLSPVSNSALGCPSASGVTLATPVTPYKITLKYAGDAEYVVYVSADTTLVQLCDSKFPALPTSTPDGTLTPSPTAGGFVSPCTLAPLGAFANVRSQPAIDALQVSVIYENNAYPIIGRNADSSWYLINEGWVSATVVQLSPNCGAIPISDALIAPGATAAPSPPSATAQPPRPPCPSGFVGYLMPRLRIGAITAQVIAGGVPNRLRSEPSITGGIIGEIQPGRRLDAVLQGPVCRDGFVWWQVNIDGNVGWTAESNAAERAYYLTPLAPDPASLPRDGILLSGHSGSITSLSFNPSGTQLLTTDAVDTFVRIWDARTGTPIQSTIQSSSTIITARYISNDSVLIGNADGTAQLWRGSAAIVTINDAFQPLIENHYAVNADGTALAVSSCREIVPDVGCRGQVTIWRLSDGALGRIIETTTSAITALTYSPDGMQLLTGDAVGTIAHLNLSETVPRTTILPNAIRDIAFFPPDPTRFIVAACMDALSVAPFATNCSATSISTYDSANLSLMGQFIIAGDARHISITTDGRLLAAGFNNGDIRLYDFADGIERRVISGIHNGPITALAFSPDNRLLASASRDATIRLWEILAPTG